MSRATNNERSNVTLHPAPAASHSSEMAAVVSVGEGER